MNKILLLIISITATFIISCDKDSDNLPDPKDTTLNNVDFKIKATYDRPDTNANFELYIKYLMGNAKDTIYDTVSNKVIWESPILNNSTKDDFYFNVTSKTLTTNAGINPSVKLSYFAIDKTIFTNILKSTSMDDIKGTKINGDGTFTITRTHFLKGNLDFRRE